MEWILAILFMILLMAVLLLCANFTVELLWKENKPGVRVGLGPLRVDVLQLQRKLEPWLARRKQRPKKQKAETEKEKKPKEPWYAPQQMEKYLELMGRMLEPVRQALVQFGHSVRLQRLEIDMVVAGEDPAVTGMLYGWGCTLLGGICGAVDSCCTIRRGRVTLTPDFTSNQYSVQADVVASIRIWRLLAIGIRLMQEYIKRRPVRERKHQTKAV